MKLHVGTNNVKTVLGQLMGWFPGRGAELAKIGEKAKLGLELDVKPLRQRHSKEQQAYYWLAVHAFGKWLGYEAHEVESLLHPAVCAATWGVKDHRTIHCQGQTYKWPVPNERSSVDADGKKRDAETYSELIESLIRFAADYGYVVPPAERKRA